LLSSRNGRASFWGYPVDTKRLEQSVVEGSRQREPLAARLDFHHGLLGMPVSGWPSGQQTSDAEVFVSIGPVDALAATKKLPVRAFCRRGS